MIGGESMARKGMAMAMDKAGRSASRLIAPVVALGIAALLGAGCAAGTEAGPTAATEPVVYAGGFSIISGTIQVPGYWKDGTWVGLTPKSASCSALVRSLAVSGSDVYAGGYCYYDGTTNSMPCYWKNGGLTELSSLGGDGSHSLSFVQALVVSGSDVYAGGHSQNSTPAAIPGYWLNGSWVPATPMVSGKNCYVTSLAVSGSDVYLGGYSINGSGVEAPGYWKNGTWTGLTPISTAYTASVMALAVSGSDVYAGGVSFASSTLIEAGYWLNGGTFQVLTPLVSGKSTYLNALVRSASGNMYAGGYCTNASGVLVPGYWKDGTWVGLTALDSTKTSVVTSIAILGSEVYAGGYSTNSSGVKVPGYWKNDTWVGLTPLDSTKDARVYSLAVVE
jgi:hypothetical protein